MKQLSVTLAFIAILGLLAYTNPTLEQYENFMNQQFLEQSKQEKDPLAGALGSLLGGLASSFLIKQTARRDYVFFSTYETAFGEEHMKSVGVLNNFFVTVNPKAMRRD